MKTLGKNSNGFISLSFVFILMTFIVLYLTAALAIAISQQRDFVRSTCITEAVQIQSSVLKQTRQLFLLNASSTALRLSIKLTQAELTMAIATANLEVIPLLERKLNALYEAQKNLDSLQKTLITQAQNLLALGHLNLITQINHGQLELSSAWRFIITLASLFKPKFTPILAIRPDSEGGMAPNYEWQDKADKKQTLAYSWNMFFYTNATYQKILSWSNTLSIECSVAPNLENEQWQLEINADK